MTKKEKIVRTTGVMICEVITVITIVMLLVTRQFSKLLLAFATILIILIPAAVERIFRCRLSLPFYLICLFYAIGPMFGNSHNFYYIIPWWDKMLHIIGGVMFAFLGLFLFEKFVIKDKSKVVMAAVFAICFSMTISVLWEFCEYGADTFFGMDMQDDVVVDHINSYLLDEELGIAGSINNIREVIVDGTKLPVDGYIDIGLNDTMWDMILETMGAVVVAVIYILKKGKLAVLSQAEAKV